MNAEYGPDELHGFALCTDDDVRTIYPAACTKGWVAERIADYEEVGSIYTEWDQSAGDAHFRAVSQGVAALAAREDGGFDRDRAFEALALALRDCRDEGLFPPDALLCCGSTDPSDHMAMLAMRAVDRLNPPAVADVFAEHLGYVGHREGRR